MAYKINNTTFEDTMYGATHNHTEDSRFDGAATCSNMFKRAKAMGAQGLAITEHGFMTSVEHAKAASAETGVKYIPGFEGYLKDETQEFEQREHMLLLSKNLDGYHANTLAVTESNSNMDDRGFPCLNWEILNKYYGPGSIGHGNVIATSACMSGIIASTLLMNQSVEKEIGKLEEKKANGCTTLFLIKGQKKLENVQIVLQIIRMEQTKSRVVKISFYWTFSHG